MSSNGSAMRVQDYGNRSACRLLVLTTVVGGIFALPSRAVAQTDRARTTPGPLSGAATRQASRPLMPIDHANSAESAWVRKPVLAKRALDDMTVAATWHFTGTGTLTLPAEPRLGDM